MREEQSHTSLLQEYTETLRSGKRIQRIPVHPSHPGQILYTIVPIVKAAFRGNSLFYPESMPCYGTLYGMWR